MTTGYRASLWKAATWCALGVFDCFAAQFAMYAFRSPIEQLLAHLQPAAARTTAPPAEPGLYSAQVKRHIKRQGENPGGIITTESPLHYSNVQLVDPVTNAPVRVTWRFLEDGTKARCCNSTTCLPS